MFCFYLILYVVAQLAVLAERSECAGAILFGLAITAWLVGLL